jgi:hypothetical protein
VTHRIHCCRQQQHSTQPRIHTARMQPPRTSHAKLHHSSRLHGSMVRSLCAQQCGQTLITLITTTSQSLQASAMACKPPPTIQQWQRAQPRHTDPYNVYRSIQCIQPTAAMRAALHDATSSCCPQTSLCPAYNHLHCTSVPKAHWLHISHQHHCPSESTHPAQQSAGLSIQRHTSAHTLYHPIPPPATARCS